MLPVTLPVFICGIITCALVEKFKVFGYGAELPNNVRQILVEFDNKERANCTKQDVAKLWVQSTAAWLIVTWRFHAAEVGLIGLSVIILATAFTGVIEEHSMGKAFRRSATIYLPSFSPSLR